MTKQASPSYTINHWLFSPQSQTLTQAERVVDLTPLQSGVIKVLIEQHPALVSASELLSILDEHAQGNRNKLYQSIAKLRRVFDDSSHNAQYIETVARQGYRLIPQPLAIQQAQEPQEVIVDADNDVEIHSGVLEQNIFDDLGFIEHEAPSEKLTETKTEALAETEVEPQAVIETPSVSHTERNEAAAPVSQPPVAATTNRASQLPPKPKSYKMIIALIIACLVMLAYWLSSDEQPEAVAQAPEAIFVKPMQFNQAAKSVDNETAVANISWWVTQKLQHLPLIKVREAKESGQYPLIVPSIHFADNGATSLTLEFWLNAKQPQATVVSLSIADKIDAETKSQYLTFNEQLVRMILNSVDIKLSGDICLATDFLNPSASENRECLVVLKQQASDKPDSVAEHVISSFPENSLGFYLASQQSLATGNTKDALKYVISALERNTNEPELLTLLSKLYRDEGKYSLSLKLAKLLVDLEPDDAQHHYWLSYDLVALGYRQRAIDILNQNKISLTSASDILYFNPLNYNVIKTWLSNENPLSEQERLAIAAVLNNDSFKTSLMPEQQLTVVNEFKNKKKERIDLPWQLAAMYLANNQLALAKKTIEDDEQTNHFIDTFSLASDDRIFYLPSYANLLLQSDQSEQAERVLQRFILLAQADSHSNMWTLTLAEAYALNNQPNKALAQLSKLLATGWLPHPQQQLWTLRNNPNFNSLKQHWEFINLLELIENRQKLILMELEATA